MTNSPSAIPGTARLKQIVLRIPSAVLLPWSSMTRGAAPGKDGNGALG